MGVSPTENECKVVATRLLAELGKPTNVGFMVVDTNGSPSGCIVCTNSCHTPWNIYFNRNAGSSNSKVSLVCSDEITTTTTTTTISAGPTCTAFVEVSSSMRMLA